MSPSFDRRGAAARAVRETIAERRWFLVALVWIAAVLLAYWGVRLQLLATAEPRSFWDPFYRTIQLIMIDDAMVVGPGERLPWQLEMSRFLLPALAAGTAFLALIAVLHREFDVLRRKFLHGHVVICGLGRKGMLLAEGFREDKRSVVAIDNNESEALEEYCREHGILLVRGDATDADTLERARVSRAAHVVALCGDDGANAEIVVRCWELMRGGSGRDLSAYCHIVDPTLCRLLRERELMSEMTDKYHLEFFNVFDSAARVVLDRHSLWLVAPSGAHIVVVGVGRMGENLIVEAGRRWWPRYLRSGDKLRITAVDRNAEAKIAKVTLAYPRLAECSDLEIVQADVNGPDFVSAPFLDQTRPAYSAPTTIFVCLDGDSAGLAVALRMLQLHRNQDVPIVVRMEHDSGLARLLLGGDLRSGSAFSSLHAFGMLDSTCRPANLLADTRTLMARAIHQNYIADRTRAGDTPSTNAALAPWEALPEDVRESNMRQADQIGEKLHAIRCSIGPLRDWAAQPLQFTAGEIERLAEMEHERFVNERRAAGWTFAPGPKDLVKKTSPTLVPWAELSEVERDKDRSAVTNTPAILALAGFEVYRLRGSEPR